MEPIHVLIADDHPFFRDGLRVLLEATADTECVGEATTGDEVITLAERMQPDVILMDLQMPGSPRGLVNLLSCGEGTQP